MKSKTRRNTGLDPAVKQWFQANMAKKERKNQKEML